MCRSGIANMSNNSKAGNMNTILTPNTNYFNTGHYAFVYYAEEAISSPQKRLRIMNCLHFKIYRSYKASYELIAQYKHIIIATLIFPLPYVLYFLKYTA